MASSYALSIDEYWQGEVILPMHVLLASYFAHTGDFASGAWALRAIGILAIIINILLIFYLFYTCLKEKIKNPAFYSWLLALIFTVLLCAYRSYEVRPEIISNTLFFISFIILFTILIKDIKPPAFTLLTIVSGIALIISVTFSYRHSLPALPIFLFLLYIQFAQLKRTKFAACVVLYIIFFLYLNTYYHNFIETILKISSIQESRIERGIFEKLTFGGSGPLIKHIYTFAMFLIFTFIAFKTKQNNQKIRIFLISCLASLVGYYIFLFYFDVRPFEYVFSIELIITIALTITFIQAYYEEFKDKSILKFIFFSVSCVSILLALYSAALNLLDVRNPVRALKGMHNISSGQTLNQSSDIDLVAIMVTSEVAFDQARARTVFCSRHPFDRAVVYRFMHHPICMRDGGSLALAGWRGSFTLNENEILQYKLISLPKERIKELEENKFLKKYSLVTEDVLIRR
ncbi:hypothetical protein G9Q38_02165 [Pusillimonas sp. DMV24BSW_D]|uniref:hypothetical protein n=1 Tax=Neopusillimonas aestuarii TaxID=2716226 RepID=UPI001409A34E|nr:hypothetical protein [Pusillimonas sp. DMV24BSW_D]QIM48067.1 hypothetical protein G9Q38_02165 [Pusillimonas sp. DMV24BSW_D]